MNPRSDLRTFVKECIKDIHTKHSRRCTPDITAPMEPEASFVEPTVVPPSPRTDPPSRLTGTIREHKLISLPATSKKARPTRPCRVCQRAGKRSESRMICYQCNVPLHSGACYEKYHTAKKL